MINLIKKITSNNRLIRNGLISLLIANILILIGKDHLLERFMNPLHYLDMLVTFISVFIILEFIDHVNQYLNRRFEWTKETSKRIINQLFFAIIIPTLLSVLITFLQWKFIWHQELIMDQYFKYEFFPQVLLILITNLIFVVVQLFRKVPVEGLATNLPIIIGRRGGKKIPVQVSKTAYIHLKNGIVYLNTFEGDEIILSENLDHFEKSLPASTFFRANRQFIMNREACKSYTTGSNGKVDVAVFPASSIIQVSQKRAASFRSWING